MLMYARQVSMCSGGLMLVLEISDLFANERYLYLLAGVFTGEYRSEYWPRGYGGSGGFDFAADSELGLSAVKGCILSSDCNPRCILAACCSAGSRPFEAVAAASVCAVSYHRFSPAGYFCPLGEQVGT